MLKSFAAFGVKFSLLEHAISSSNVAVLPWEDSNIINEIPYYRVVIFMQCEWCIKKKCANTLFGNVHTVHYQARKKLLQAVTQTVVLCD